MWQLSLLDKSITEDREIEAMLNCFCVGMGGFLGAAARYLLSLIPVQDKSGFPWNTFFINAAGAFLIGCISAFAAKKGIGSSSLILFLKTGVCGGFTTFSTFALESYELMENGKGVLSVIYMIASVLVCLGAVMLAQKII